ncbi:MAG: copper homeostasis protein CutC [Lacrimispora sp.]
MLEICCGSYYDALQAAAGGAGRIELNCGLHLGGLTPSLASLELVKECCNIPVIAMVRPRGGGFCYSGEDYDVMLRECRDLVRHGADGIAFGCLKKDASIDRERNARLISMIHSHGKEAVFHRAFDCTANPYEAMEALIDLGADRVLTSGLKPEATEGKALLKILQAAYGDRIQILAGSGINAFNAKQLMEETGIRQIHSSCKDWLADPTTAANGISYGFGPEPYSTCYDVVSADLVRQLLDSMGEFA